MASGHEKLDVYRAAIADVGWAYRYCEKLKGHRDAENQLLRASQAIALKTVAGKGPRVTAKRRTGIDAGMLRSHGARRWRALRFRTCRRCARRCPQTRTIQQKALLDRLVAMLTKLGQRGYAVREELGESGVGQFDTDTDTDTDTDLLANDT